MLSSEKNNNSLQRFGTWWTVHCTGGRSSSSARAAQSITHSRSINCAPHEPERKCTFQPLYSSFSSRFVSGYTVETNKYRAGNEFPNRTPVFRRDTAGTGQAQGTIIPVILMQFLRDVLYRALAKPWGYPLARPPRFVAGQNARALRVH